MDKFGEVHFIPLNAGHRHMIIILFLVLLLPITRVVNLV